MPSRPVVLFVAATPPVSKPTLGGNHRYLLDLLETAVALGAEAHLLSDEARHYEELLARVDALGVRRRAAPFCTDAPTATAALDAALDALQPALVHVNGHAGWLAPAVLGSRRLASVPRRLHTMHLAMDSLEAQQDRPFRWIDKLPGRWAARQTAQDRRFLACFSDVLSVSHRYGRLLSELGYLTPERVTIVPNGVDSDRFRPRAGDSPDSPRLAGPVRIGAAGNLHPQKRFDLLLEAFARLRAPAELQIAGEGPEEQALRAKASALGLADRVAFLGFQRDMPAFLADLDVFAMTSDAEAAPYAQLEAMACGLPAVVTAVGDLPFFLRDGVDGFLAPVGDVPAIAAGLEKLVADHALRRALGASARARALEEFSLIVWRRRMGEYLRTRLP
ncbi:MAG: glycosyltransferase [Acidobacteria bacterium]|nr:glycosyltransferase [Acidobacteriota bacterium]